ncbi:unnamed protein product [Chrysoparadoxa australica]
MSFLLLLLVLSATFAHSFLVPLTSPQHTRCPTTRPMMADDEPPALTPALKEKIDGMVETNSILLFMKGNRLMPQCGYSGTCVAILEQMSVEYETVDVLADERIRSGMKEYSSWPTYPQLYLSGEFVGGADIVIEMFQSGELQEMIEIAAAS